MKPVIVKKIMHNLQLLVNARQIKLYGYAILPNRLEFLWEMTHAGGDESSHIQFLKLSSFDFLETLRKEDKKLLDKFCIDMLFHKIQFWQKTSQPVKVEDEEEAFSVLKNMHHKAKMLSVNSEEEFSSQAFYESGNDASHLLNHYQEYFSNKTVSVI